MNKTKTPQEYEDIIRKLIFSNCFKALLHGRNRKMSINFGPGKITWEGSHESTLDIPMNYLFRKVMGYE